MKEFRIRTFLVCTLVFVFLLIPSFLAAFAQDERTLVTNIVWIIFADLFYVLRFPTHTLLWTFVSKYMITYFPMLVVNCFFYGLITERLIFIFKKIRQPKNTCCPQGRHVWVKEKHKTRIKSEKL